MDASDLGKDVFFTTNGKDIWKLQSYCLRPTCELLRMSDGMKESFGMGGLTAQRFHRIEMPKQALKGGDE